MPPIQPETAARLEHPDGQAIANINPALAKAFEQELRRFQAAAQPWHLYRPRVKDYAACRCGAETHTPGRDRWMWRKIVGTHYAALNRATGFGKRGESLCPACQRQYGIRPVAA